MRASAEGEEVEVLMNALNQLAPCSLSRFAWPCHTSGVGGCCLAMAECETTSTGALFEPISSHRFDSIKSTRLACLAGWKI